MLDEGEGGKGGGWLSEFGLKGEAGSEEMVGGGMESWSEAGRDEGPGGGPDRSPA